MIYTKISVHIMGACFSRLTLIKVLGWCRYCWSYHVVIYILTVLTILIDCWRDNYPWYTVMTLA